VNCFLVDGQDSCNLLSERVLEVAADALHCDEDDLYVLYNGTPLRRSRSVEIRLLGIHDGSTLSVHRRLRGGVCIAQNASGRKRSVSNDGSSPGPYSRIFVLIAFGNLIFHYSTPQQLLKGVVGIVTEPRRRIRRNLCHGQRFDHHAGIVSRTMTRESSRLSGKILYLSIYLSTTHSLPRAIPNTTT
jgi:hypothetical protein